MIPLCTNELSGRELDYQLAFYCAPVVAGIKPAGIFSVKKPAPFSLHGSLARVARPLGGKGLYFFRLMECERRVLLIIYNRELLLQRLRAPETAALLARYGYGAGSSLGALLGQLATRIREKQGFPHEIGAFLGYPVPDVEQFIQTGGQGFKLCGYWKVYSDVERAKCIFSVYDKARDYFCRRVADGEEIYNITFGGCAV